MEVEGYEPWVTVQHPNAVSAVPRYAGIVLVRGTKVRSVAATGPGTPAALTARSGGVRL